MEAVPLGPMRSFLKLILREIVKVCTGLFALILILIIFPFYLVLLLRWWVAGLIVRLRRGDTAQVASGMDVLWTMDPENPDYAINAAFFLEGAMDLQEIRNRIENQIHRPPSSDESENPMRKLTRHLADEFGVCTWREEKDFRIEEHVVLHDEPVSTENELQALLSWLGPLPFPPKKSPWCLHLLQLVPPLVKHHSATGEQFCAVFRVDHALGDGISFVSILLRCVADSQKESMPPPSAPRAVHEQPDKASRVFDAILNGPSIILGYLTQKEQNALHNVPLTRDKLVRWSRPIPLQVFREIRAATGATINDIYLSCVAGTLRRHFLTCGSPFPPIPKSVVPISLHANPRIAPLENNISVVLINVPIDFEDPLKRLDAASTILKAAKSSSEVLVNAWSFRWIVNVIPLWMTRRMFKSTPATLVTATVPGPTQKISMWGYQVNRMLYFAPHRGSTGVTSCMISYAGQVILTIYVDSALVAKSSQVDDLINGFHIELERLAVASQQTTMNKQTKCIIMNNKDSFDLVENDGQEKNRIKA